MQPRTAEVAKLGLFVLFVLLVGAAIGLDFSSRFLNPSEAVPFPDFMRDLDAGQIEQITIAGQKVSGIYSTNKQTFHTYAPAQYRGLADDLDAKGVLRR